MAERLFAVGDNYPDFRWDPGLGLCVPDALSVLHTRELALDIRLRRYVRRDTEETIRVAIAGDTGLYAVGLMKQLLDAQEPFADGPLELEVFDKDPGAVATAKLNIAALGRYMSGFSAHVFEADWNDAGLRQYLQRNPVHFLISNPPFLPTAHAHRLVASGKSSDYRLEYAHTSLMALDGGEDGLEHLKTLLRCAPEILVDEGPTGVFLRYSFHSEKGEINRVIDELFGYATRRDFRTFEGVGPSSLGQRLSDITGGDPRILATVAVRQRPPEDISGREDISKTQAEMSIRHAAALGGTVLSAGQCDQLLTLRKRAELSFAEEEILIAGLRYLAVNMRRPCQSGVTDIFDLPRWERDKVLNGIGYSRLVELTHRITEQGV